MSADEPREPTRRALDSEDGARFLAEASAALAGSLDYKLTLARVAELAVPYLADWCAIDAIDAEPGQSLQFARIAAVHVEPGKAELAREMQKRYPPDPAISQGYPKVLRTGEPDFWPDVPDESLVAHARDAEHLRMMREIGYRSYMSVPLAARGRNLGTMTFVIARSGRTFSEQDLAFAMDLGRRAGLALDNARLFRDLETAGRRTSLLAEASRLLAGSLDTETTLPLVAGLVGPEMGGRCVIEIVDEAGTRSRIGEQDADTERARLDAPIIAKGELLGTMSFCCSRTDYRYGRADVSFAADLANRVALAVVNRRLYAHARDSVRVREEFLSVASHELRTPLTALMLVVRMLRSLPAETSREQVASKLSIAENQLEKISHTITRLFDVSRVGANGAAGRLSLELEDVDLFATTKEVLARFEEDLGRAGCVASLTGAPVVGRWDKFRLEQVVTNLLSNALKFGAGSQIEITVENDGSIGRLTVADHGIGIAPEDVSRIFGRYARGSQSRAFDGLGLGLHIVEKILDSLGGSIVVRSAPGEGATFVVEIPCAPLPIAG